MFYKVMITFLGFLSGFTTASTIYEIVLQGKNIILTNKLGMYGSNLLIFKVAFSIFILIMLIFIIIKEKEEYDAGNGFHQMGKNG